MTHEEVMTDIARNELRSYKQLPQLVSDSNQVSRRASAEAGLLRVRQFIMKDSYTFDLDASGAGRSFGQALLAYRRIFDRSGFEYGRGEAHSGAHGREPVARIHGAVRCRRGFRGALPRLRLCRES